MTYAYPIVLETDGDVVNVTVPDIFGAVTFGYGEADAIAMAKDLIKLMLRQAPAQCFPPKSLEYTQKNFPNAKVVTVEVSV